MNTHTGNTDPVHPEKKIPAKKKRNYKIIFGLLGAVIIILLAWYGWSNRTLEKSTQSGYVLKMSQKGFPFKTYEGQLSLAMAPVAYAANPSSGIWNFSIKKKDKELYDQLVRLQDKVVTVSYREQARKFPWQGRTKQFAYDVKELAGNFPNTLPEADTIGSY